jgi:ComEC/Rec2-related protein
LAPLLVLGGASVLGVALEELLRLPWWAWAPAFLAGVLAALWQGGAWQRGICVVVTAVAAFAMLHGLRLPSPEELGQVETPQVVVFTGTVMAEPKITPYRVTLLARVDRWEVGDGWLPARGRRVLVVWQGAPPRYGEAVRVRGTLSRIQSPHNPGPWDRAAWHAQRGIYFQVQSLYVRDCEVPSDLPWRGNAVVAAGLATRDWMAARLRLGLEDVPVTAGILQGLVLGVMDSSEPQLFDLFRETGTLHLFAVSGLHVGMAVLFFTAILQGLGLGRRRVAAFMIPLLVAYAVVTGLQVPVVRSVLIASVFCAATLLFRKGNMLNCTGASAVLLLLWDTRQALQPGFQFSFCVVLSILFVAGVTERLVRRVAMPDPFLPRSLWTWWQEAWGKSCRWGISLVLSSLAAWAGSLPLTIGYTHLVSWISIGANLVVVPVSFFVVVAGLVSVSVAWVPLAGPWLAASCNQFSWLVIQGILFFLNACWQVPGGFHYSGPPRLDPPPVLSATVLDLPRGGGAVSLQVEGQRWLVDTGGDVPFLAMAEPALRFEGFTRADGLILTHQDSGHIGGLAEAEVLLRPRDLFAAPRLDLQASNPRYPGFAERPARVLSRGDRLPLGPNSRLEVLWPPIDLAAGIADDRCLVLRVVTPAGKILLMGDSGIATESALLQAGEDLRADVLIQHGHATDAYGSEAFLRAVNPRGIILAGPGGNRPLYIERGLRLTPPPGLWQTSRQKAIRVELGEGKLEVAPAE